MLFFVFFAPVVMHSKDPILPGGRTEESLKQVENRDNDQRYE